MRLDESCERAFARHESFHPRYGWIKKAVDAAAREDDVFNRDDAVVELGVGKNMVKSIKHWGLACKVITPAPGGGRRPRLQPTPMGAALFGADGADPYMELPGTDWLIHWLLHAPPSQAPVAWLALNEFTAIEFEEGELLQFAIDRLATFANIQESSIKKDVSVFLRMYSSGHGVRATIEERIDAPFRGLGLLQPSIHERGMFRFNVAPKPTLPPMVFASVVLDFVARTDSDSRVVSLSRALAEVGSPGRVYKLTDDAVLDLLQAACDESKVISLATAAGMPQLILDESPASTSRRLLKEHYWRYGARLEVAYEDQEQVA